MYVEHYDTRANSTLNIKLPIKSYSILVKNFTNGDIRITLNKIYDTDEDNYILIPANYSQELTINKRHELDYKINRISIHAESTQALGVEVQCLTF